MTWGMLRVVFGFTFYQFGYSWTIPLPGGRKIQYDNGGVLRIQLNSVDLPPFPSNTTCVEAVIRIQDAGKKGRGAFAAEKIWPSIHSWASIQDKLSTATKWTNELRRAEVTTFSAWTAASRFWMDQANYYLDWAVLHSRYIMYL